MDGRGNLLLPVALGIFALLARDASANPELKRSWRADAALHDVQFVSARDGWSVGDHGTLWQTADGGTSWTLVDTGTDAALRSVCLLTDRIGWIAGWQTRGSAELATGMLLATRDGGQSWQPLETQSLSPLRYVKFFGLEEGIVVGEPTADNATGVWATTDGGQTWQPLEGFPSRGWNAVDLSSPELGILADRTGGVSLLAGPKLLPSKLPALKGRSIRDVAFSTDHRAWLVGDGGLAMQSSSGGVVWELPSGPLPEELRQVSDFRAVAVRNDAVWIAGRPGGVIWHSPNNGARWVRQTTGVTTPLNAIHFVNARSGCAVGELGVILVTDNGGETWSVAQGRGRHAALLSIHHRVSTLSPDAVVKIAGEQGYRTASLVAIKPQEVAQGLPIENRISAALTQSGGSAGAVAWPLSLEIPGLELSSDKLLDYWQRRTEGQLPQMLLGRLVGEIRAWRPHVVIVDQPAPEDAAGQLIFDATLRAVEQAADSTRNLVQREYGGLNPWKVERVYLQLLPGNTGEISLDPYEFLPHWQTSARLAANPARDLLAIELTSPPNFRSADAAGNTVSTSKFADFFTGLTFTHSDVRRDVRPIENPLLDQQLKAVQRHRNFTAYIDKSLDDPRVAGQMLAQMKDVTTGMSAEQSAQTLSDLFEEYRSRGRWELAEATGQELLRKHPDQPVSADVARWLFTYLTSEEAAWRRTRQLATDRRARPLLAAQSSVPAESPARKNQFTHLPETRERQKKAQQLEQFLESQWPQLFRSGEMDFLRAASLRARGAAAPAEVIAGRWVGQEDNRDARDWSAVARREVWLSQFGSEIPDGVATCLRTTIKPQLDGLLSDECWQDANECRLTFRAPASLPETPPVVLFAYDDDFLYVAATVKRLDGQSKDAPKTAGRTHDADLRRHDRIAIRFDVDRDYATWYTFEVDQRGWTAESCWNDAGWNPHWFVAAAGDAANWRIELAIPWAELCHQRPDKNAAWGLSLERTAPAAGQHAWTQPTSTPGASLGILRFE